MARYSAQFRNNVLRKVLPPENRPIHEVSAEMGISVQTIYGWVKKVKNGTYSSEDGALRPADRSLKEKLRLLLEYLALPEGQTGEWLRENGVHSEHITLWEQELHDHMAKSETERQAEIKHLKRRTRELERELARKEKALAEIAALLTLKKN